jgi:hypothetical protein
MMQTPMLKSAQLIDAPAPERNVLRQRIGLGIPLKREFEQKL